MHHHDARAITQTAAFRKHLSLIPKCVTIVLSCRMMNFKPDMPICHTSYIFLLLLSKLSKCYWSPPIVKMPHLRRRCTTAPTCHKEWENRRREHTASTSLCIYNWEQRDIIFNIRNITQRAIESERETERSTLNCDVETRYDLEQRVTTSSGIHLHKLSFMRH